MTRLEVFEERDALFTDAFDAIKDEIEDNITDPRGRHKTTIVHSSRQFPSEDNFCGYPYVVVYPPMVDQVGKSNDYNKVDYSLTLVVEIISDTTTDLDKISDKIADILNDIDNIDFITSNTERDFIDDEEVFLRTIELSSFDRVNLVQTETVNLLTESGDFIVQENGDNILVTVEV